MYINSLNAFNTKKNNNIINFSFVNKKFSFDKNINKENKNDKLFISSQGKLVNMIEELNKQKENIIKKKNEVINNNIENNGNKDIIKAQISLYEEQIKNIDKQISELYSQQLKEFTNKDTMNYENKNKSNKSEEEIEFQNLNNISFVFNDIKNIKLISSNEKKFNSEIKIKESEINFNKLNIDNLKSKELFEKNINVEDSVLSQERLINDKKNKILDLRTRISDLNKILTEKVEKVNNIEKIEKNELNSDVNNEKDKILY